MEGSDGQDIDPKVRRMEAKLSDILGPFESLLMKTQSLLVWEKPWRSVIMMVAVHVAFWFLATTSYGMYSMVSFLGLVAIFIDTWKNRIWPEIRVPPSSPEDPEGWTPIHPRLLSVPEICQRTAEVCVTVSRLAHQWGAMRKNKPLQFCLLNCGVCTLLAMVGHYISGLMLSYILVISLLLWPCIIYHNLLQKIYLQGEPLFMRLDYCLKFRGRWPFRTRPQKRGSRTQRHSVEGEGEGHVEVDTDSELEDFVPSVDPATTAALARAITDSEDEGGTPLATPLLSKEPSVSDNYTDDDADMEMRSHDFYQGLEEMPSFEEVLDQTDDETDHAPLVTKPQTKSNILSSSRSNSKETTPDDGRMNPMHFVPTHFRDSDSEEDEHTVTRDLAFPDIAEVSETESTYSGGSAHSLVSAVTASVMQQSLTSSVMSAAMSGLNRLGDTMRGAVQPQQPARHPKFSLGEDDCPPDTEITLPAGQGDVGGEGSEESDYSDDTEEADDFEFLDDDELQNYEKNKP